MIVSERLRFHHQPRIGRAAGLFLAICVLAVPRATRAQESVLTLDPAQTKIAYTLDATFHTVHGTFS